MADFREERERWGDKSYMRRGVSMAGHDFGHPTRSWVTGGKGLLAQVHPPGKDGSCFHPAIRTY